MTASSSDGGAPTMVDSQFTSARILTPQDGYDTLYEGQSTLKPIILNEGAGGLDPLTSITRVVADVTEEGFRVVRAGYSNDLVKGMAVPLGARALLWLPIFFSTSLSDPYSYRWALIWRIRNLFEYRQDRRPWHLPLQAADSDGYIAVPAAYETVQYVQPEPLSNTKVAQHVQGEDIQSRFKENMTRLPRVFNTKGSATNGRYSQGSVFDTLPGYFIHETQCLGDELLLCLYRLPEDGETTWEMKGADSRVFDFFEYDSAASGAFLFTGSAP